MTFKYSQKYEKGKTARAVGLALPISFKKAVEVCNLIRGEELEKGIKTLGLVAEEKMSVPFRRFARGGTGHKRGIGPGRYPKKTCTEILKILKSARANAEQKGLSNLTIKNIMAQKAAKALHYGRKPRREQKRSHIEVLLEQDTSQKPQATSHRQQSQSSRETKK